MFCIPRYSWATFIGNPKTLSKCTLLASQSLLELDQIGPNERKSQSYNCKNFCSCDKTLSIDNLQVEPSNPILLLPPPPHHTTPHTNTWPHTQEGICIWYLDRKPDSGISCFYQGEICIEVYLTGVFPVLAASCCPVTLPASVAPCQGLRWPHQVKDPWKLWSTQARHIDLRLSGLDWRPLLHSLHDFQPWVLLPETESHAVSEQPGVNIVQ